LSEIIFQIMGIVLVGSMVVSLVIVALPGPRQPTPTPFPTWTPILRPTATPSATPLPTPTFAPTEAVLSPQPPTETPLPTPTPPVGLTPTLEISQPVVGPELPTATPEPTPAGADLDFTFAICGDSRDNPAVYRRVLEAVAADGSEFLIHTGDLVNRGTEAQWLDFRETMAGFPLPFYPVPGNHDGLDGKLANYLTHSGAPAPHFSFERGGVHFCLADSHHGGIGAKELAWLREDLAATDQPVKIVVLHHPPFDPDGTDHIMAYGNEAFMAAMAELEVDYVFAGHIHAYAQEERDGVLYTITGGAGAPLYGEDHPQSYHHYLRVAVRGEEIRIEVVEI
jgi:predicted phosphodiesterase